MALHRLTDAAIERGAAEALQVRRMLVVIPASTSERASGARPIVAVHAEHRRDVQDLGRVHQTDGTGAITTLWVYALHQYPQRIFLVAHLIAPVTTDVVLEFALPRAVQFLEVVARTGTMIITTSRASHAVAMQHALLNEDAGIAIDVSNGSELRQVLDHWKSPVRPTLP